MSEGYLVHGVSESGDTYIIGMYYDEPTEAQLSAIIREEAPQEIAGNTSYLRPQVTKTRFRVLPEADPEPLRYV